MYDLVNCDNFGVGLMQEKHPAIFSDGLIDDGQDNNGSNTDTNIWDEANDVPPNH